MTNIELLIFKLDRKLKLLHEEISFATKSAKVGTLEQGYLFDYVSLTTRGGIIPGIEFIILDSLSKHFNIYEDEQEHQQILVAMASELKDASNSDLFASTKIIKNTYPSIYLLIRERLTHSRTPLIDEIVIVFTGLDIRSKLFISAVIIGAIISTTFNRSPSHNSSTPATTIETPEQTVAPTQAVVTQQTPAPEQTATTQQAPVINSEPVVKEDRQSGLSTLSYQGHCTLLSAQNQSENIVDDNCNIAHTVDRKNYTLNWTNGEISNIEIITDRQAVINGEQATIIQKNSNGITISFSKGRIGWDLKE